MSKTNIMVRSALMTMLAAGLLVTTAVQAKSAAGGGQGTGMGMGPAGQSSTPAGTQDRDQLQTQDRDRLKTQDQLETQDRDRLKTQDQLRTQDRDRLNSNAQATGTRVRSEANLRLQVRTMQEALNRHGASLKPDGLMGPRTRAALRAFQRSQGIPVTGGLNAETRMRLGIE